MIGIIGIILLIGIVKKNGIILVDFAISRERSGLSPREAVRQACLLRFRPITMTTMTALLTGLPLMLGTGRDRNCASRSATPWSAGSHSASADIVHHAGDLSLSRPVPGVAARR